MDGGAWWAAVHGVAKSWTQLCNFTFIFHFHALEKEMATHSSVLAWRIPGTGEPRGLLSLGSQSRTRLKRLSSSSSSSMPSSFALVFLFRDVDFLCLPLVFVAFFVNLLISLFISSFILKISVFHISFLLKLCLLTLFILVFTVI